MGTTLYPGYRDGGITSLWKLLGRGRGLGSGTAIDEEFYSLIVFVGLHELLDSEMHTIPPVMVGIGGDIDALVFDVVTT